MAEVPKGGHDPTTDELDERVELPLDPEEALRALLKVDPESEPAEGRSKDPS
jgi:hypothetical protein